MLETAELSGLHEAVAAARAALEARCAEVNDLNVYPVADGDTGTNMLLTARAAERAAAESTGLPSAERPRARARAALAGPRAVPLPPLPVVPRLRLGAAARPLGPRGRAGAARRLPPRAGRRARGQGARPHRRPRPGALARRRARDRGRRDH